MGLRRALYGIPDRVATEAVVTTRLVRQAGSAVPDLADRRCVYRRVTNR